MAQPQRIGQQLGNYRLTRLLGTGGFAEVYLGEHIHLGTQAAVKVLHTRLEQDDAAAFGEEARTIARLKHPHIVRVLDFGIDGTVPYLVMDYAPHGSLRSRHARGVQLPLEVVQAYVQQLADALQYAHDRKLIHRDLKPENILVDEDGSLVLSDFGIATMAQSSRSQNTQDIVGTAAYMAPEQLQGKPRPASDQYSFGIMVYEWLSGTRPFLGTFTEIASQHLLTPPPPVRQKRPDLPVAIEQVLATTLQKDPHERFGSVKAFAVAFEQAYELGRVSEPEGNIKTQASLMLPASGMPVYPSSAIAPPPPGIGIAPPPPGISATPPASQPGASQVKPEVAKPQRIMPPSPVSQPGAPLLTPEAARPQRITPSLYTPVSTPRGSAPPITSEPALRPGQWGAPVRKQKSKKRGWLYGLLAALVLGLILAITLPPLIANYNAEATTPGPNFRQTVVTSTDVTSLAVGTGYTSGSTPDGVSATFYPGNTVYLVCDITHVGAAITDTLKVGSTTVSTSSGLTDQSDLVFYDNATVQIKGIYTWAITYIRPGGTQQASITFQVV